MAVWVPHLIIHNHVPACPNCKKNKYVDVTKARWINSPKILYGVDSHRYLDTQLYPCHGCARRFAGYNKASMQVDANVYYGYFNFFLGKHYAVDEQLYRHTSSLLLPATQRQPSQSDFCSLHMTPTTQTTSYT